MLRAISDRRVREKLHDRIDQLSQDPEKQGKPLEGELAGLRSVRAFGQRYRVIYRVEKKVVVVVGALGIRKAASKRDIYSVAKRLLRLGLLGPPR
jgi:mRNA interferase RelE/StbE